MQTTVGLPRDYFAPLVSMQNGAILATATPTQIDDIVRIT
jgi:hypothetical protein